MKIDKKQILLICIIAVMVAVFFFLQYLPSKKAQHIETVKKIQTTMVEDDFSKLPVLLKKANQLKDEVGDFNSEIPEKRDFGVFLSSVTSMMSKHSLNNQMVKPGPEQVAGKISIIPITMECSGQLSNVFNFFKDMESSKRLFRIEKLKLENKGYAGKVKVFAKGSIFYQSQI